MANLTVTGRLLTGAEKLFVGENGQFNAIVLLDDENVKKVEAAKKKALEDEFGDKIPAKLQDYAIRDGDDPEFEHTYEQKFINAKKKKVPAPRVVRKVNGELEPLTMESGVIYAGCYVAANISVYAYPGGTGPNGEKILPGASVGLSAVMFLKDGEPLGDNVNLDDAFGDFESEVEDDF